MGTMFKTSLRNRLSLAIVMLVMLTSGVIGALAFDATESSLYEAASSRVKAIAESSTWSELRGYRA